MFTILSSLFSIFQDKTSLILYIIIGALVTALTVFFFLYRSVTVRLEEKQIEASLWKSSAESAESTIDSLLANQKKLDEVTQKMNLAKLSIETNTKEIKGQFEALKVQNMTVRQWANEEIPQDVQNLLFNTK